MRTRMVARGWIFKVIKKRKKEEKNIKNNKRLSASYFGPDATSCEVPDATGLGTKRENPGRGVGDQAECEPQSEWKDWEGGSPRRNSNSG